MTASFTAAEYEALEAGIYPARLDSIEIGTSETYGDFNRWNFTLKLPDGAFTTLTAVSSRSSGPKSKAYKWASAILGRNPKAGEQLDLSGKQCQLHVIVNEEGFNRVEAVLPITEAKPTTGTTSQAKPVPFNQTVEVTDPQDAPLPF